VRGHGSDTMRPVWWDLTGLNGINAYIWVEDASTAPSGWICVDEIRLNQSAVPTPELPTRRARLLPNRPNPFNPRTELGFEIDASARIDLRIFDLRGRLVRTLDAGRLEAGAHRLSWDGTDAHGREVTSGVYIVGLRADSVTLDQRKITLVR